MKITPAEKRLIGKVAPTLQELVLNRLASQFWTFTSHKLRHNNRFIVALVNLARFILLAAELLTIALRPRGGIAATVFYDDQPSAVAARERYLALNRPETNFLGLSYKDRIGRFPGRRQSIRLMWNLFVAIMHSLLYSPSYLTPNMVRAVRISMLAYAAVHNSEARSIYLFRIYRPEMAIVAAFLEAHEIKVHLVASNAPLAPYNRVMIGHSIKVANGYQLDEFKHYCANGSCQRCEMWPTEELEHLRKLYRGRSVSRDPASIAVYTEGYSLRSQLGQLAADFSHNAVKCEAELLDSILIYAREKPEVRIVLFPHPMERRHHKATGRPLYEDLVTLPNIELADLESVNSTSQFDSVGLGLTTWSSVGFERIQLGYRSLFYVAGLSHVDWSVESNFQHLFIKDQDSLISACSEYSQITNHAFMMRIFGGYLPPRRSVTCGQA